MKRQFTISRKKWLRGTNTKDGDSYLKHPSKPLFCCLGLIATQCEVPVRKLTGLCTPEQIPSILQQKVDFLLDGRGWNPEWIETAMEVNDDEKLSDEKREKKLASLFKRHNIELTFTE